MPKSKFGACKEQTVTQATDEYGGEVTIVRSIIDNGPLGKKVTASATRTKDGMEFAYAEGNDALVRVLTALGVTMISLLVVAAAGVIVYMLATGMVG